MFMQLTQNAHDIVTMLVYTKQKISTLMNGVPIIIIYLKKGVKIF